MSAPFTTSVGPARERGERERRLGVEPAPLLVPEQQAVAVRVELEPDPVAAPAAEAVEHDPGGRVRERR